MGFTRSDMASARVPQLSPELSSETLLLAARTSSVGSCYSRQFQCHCSWRCTVIGRGGRETGMLQAPPVRTWLRDRRISDERPPAEDEAVNRLHRHCVPCRLALHPRNGRRSVDSAAEVGSEHRARERVPKLSDAKSVPQNEPSSSGGPRSRRPAIPRASKALVLGALSGDHVMTAAEVAEATGLSSNAVETRLNELVKRGDVSKTTRETSSSA